MQFSTIWPCSLVTTSAHTHDPNFYVLCGIHGRGRTYKNFYSFRSHVNRTHKGHLQAARDITELQQVRQHVEPQEQADVEEHYVEEAEEDENQDNYALEFQLRYTSAAYLLRMKETHNLPQKALDDIVQNTKTLVSEAVKTVCVSFANQLQNEGGANIEEAANITWQALYEGNANVANPFQGLETEKRQRQAYKDMFGLWYV